ncbi:LytR C-terminal domain-containing protein [Candidatus Shapirobacteria bacterium]|nr:LytR C-terminal domain-containing protein [Candidatus Shapirobacteria bacterium]
MKKWIKLCLVITVGLVVANSLGLKNVWINNNDYRIGVISPEGVGLVSVSDQRKMVNLLVIPKDSVVWIPFGPGKYEVNKITKLFEIDKQLNLEKMMFVYNWGFVPNKIITINKVEDWELSTGWWNEWGVVNWLRYRLNEGDWWYRTSVLKGAISSKNGDMVDTLSRDFADATTLRDNVKLAIYNDSGSDGLAGFIANILEWSGMSVVGLENSDGQKTDGCIFNYGKEVGGTRTEDLLKKMFPDCSWVLDEKKGGNLVDLYFGEKYAQVINYESYKTNY